MLSKIANKNKLYVVYLDHSNDYVSGVDNFVGFIGSEPIVAGFFGVELESDLKPCNDLSNLYMSCEAKTILCHR